MRIRILGALGVLLVGCGGKVVFVEEGAGGGTAASSASVGGTTVGTSSGAGGSSACPDGVDPVQGAACMTPGQTCSLPNECCNPTAVCTNGVWEISAPDCQSACITCGPSLGCAGNAVCVSTQVDAFVMHKCAANPCVDQALSCSCAAPLCSAAGECTAAANSQVTCETFTD